MSNTALPPPLRLSLKARSEAMLAHRLRKIAEADRHLLDWMIAAGVTGSALKAGDLAPNFTLPDAYGRLVTSEDLLQAGPLIVSFLRGSWCSFGAAELRALSAVQAELSAEDATLIAITPDAGPYLKELATRQGVGFNILSDVDYGVALSFGVVFAIPERFRPDYLHCGIDLPHRHGNPGWMLPISSTYLIDQRKLICDAHVQPDVTSRRDPGVLVDLVMCMSKLGR